MADNRKKVFEYSKSGSSGSLVLLEPLTLDTAPDYDKQLNNYILTDDIQTLVVDFNKIENYDSFAALFINTITQTTAAKGVSVSFTGMNPEMESFIGVLNREAQLPGDEIEYHSWIVSHVMDVGNVTVRILKDARKFTEFVGELIIKILILFVNPWKMRWKDFPFQFFRSGVAALPIILLILFLIGLVTGYQGAVQLHQFGADMYIADMVGISITRELGPLMTAIIIAGRSGSSFAAEIGTMKVSEEIDALNSMGFDFMRFLVMPRVMSVLFAMPLLTLFADLAGVIGGLVSALAVLDITLSSYINGLQGALDYGDVMGGLFKSMVFGFLIATVGCFRGMQVSGGAESVGKFTTASVVSGIFLIIVADAVFTFIFTSLGI
jgi:phospholipid/cholesterol/gamma-HCH transport system permease protein